MFLREREEGDLFETVAGWAQGGITVCLEGGVQTTALGVPAMTLAPYWLLMRSSVEHGLGDPCSTHSTDTSDGERGEGAVGGLHNSKLATFLVE